MKNDLKIIKTLDDANINQMKEKWYAIYKGINNSQKDCKLLNCYYFLIYRLPFYLKEFWRKFKGFFQRGLKGYAKYDLWDFDLYLCKIIGNGIKELAEKATGSPADISYENWVEILNKMSDGFLNFYEKEVNGEGACKEDNKKLKESLSLFKKYFKTLWD